MGDERVRRDPRRARRDDRRVAPRGLGPQYGFDGIGGLVASGNDLWIADYGTSNPPEPGPAIDEVNATTGALIRTIPPRELVGPGGLNGGMNEIAIAGDVLWVGTFGGYLVRIDATNGVRLGDVYGAKYEFGYTSVMAVVGSNLWVQGGGGASTCLTIVSATSGALVDVECLPSSGFVLGLLAVGNVVWAADAPSNELTAFNATTFAPERTITGSPGQFDLPGRLAVAGGDLWVANQQGSVTEVDAVSGDVVRVLPDIHDPSDVLAAGGRMWVTSGVDDAILAIDPKTGAVLDDAVGADGLQQPVAVAVSNGDLWVANEASSTVTELDVATGAVLAQLPGSTDGFDRPGAIAAAGGTVWVASLGTNTLTAIKATSRAVLATEPCTCADTTEGLVADGSDVWVATSDDSLTRYGPTGAVVTSITGAGGALDGPMSLAVGDGALWVVNDDNTLAEFNDRTGVLIRVVDGHRFGVKTSGAVAVAGGNVWFSTENVSTLTQADAKSGAVLHTFKSSLEGHHVTGLAVVGNRLFVSYVAEYDQPLCGLNELNATSGRILSLVGTAGGELSGVAGFAVSDSTIFVADSFADSVTSLRF